MDDNGRIADPTREAPSVSDEEALTWYKNMLTGKLEQKCGGQKCIPWIGDTNDQKIIS